MSCEKVGHIKVGPTLGYEWIIPDFRSIDSTNWLYSPEFTIKKVKFALCGYFNKNPVNQIWLNKISGSQLELTLLKIDVVGSDGSEIAACSKSNVAFKAYQTFLDLNDPDGEFGLALLTPVFLANGELRVRCRINCKNDSKDLSIVDAISKPTIIDDLRKASDVTNMTFTDFELSCDSEVFPVHRFMLAARSTVFKAMFENKNTLEAKRGSVEIEDLDPKTLRTALNFIYTDEVDDDAISPALLTAADKYNLQTLFNKCEHRLCETISVENAGDYFMTGFLHSAKSLKDLSAKFIIDNFDAVEDTEGMKLVRQDPKALFEILKFSHGK